MSEDVPIGVLVSRIRFYAAGLALTAFVLGVLIASSLALHLGVFCS